MILRTKNYLLEIYLIGMNIHTHRKKAIETVRIRFTHSHTNHKIKKTIIFFKIDYYCK